MHASISMPDNPELAGGAQRVHLNYLAPPVLHLQFALGHCSPWKWRKKKKKNQHLSLITYSLIGREEGEVEIDFDIYIFIVLSFSLSLPT